MASDWFNAWFTKVHRFAFHRTNGRIGGKLGNIPMALMYTIGAKTGQVRMIPLQCYPVEPEGVLCSRRITACPGFRAGTTT